MAVRRKDFQPAFVDSPAARYVSRLSETTLHLTSGKTGLVGRAGRQMACQRRVDGHGTPGRSDVLPDKSGMHRYTWARRILGSVIRYGMTTWVVAGRGL
jgi:hypothetical protein